MWTKNKPTYRLSVGDSLRMSIYPFIHGVAFFFGKKTRLEEQHGSLTTSFPQKLRGRYGKQDWTVAEWRGLEMRRSRVQVPHQPSV